MAIVKMKKLRVMAMADQRDELLKGLLHLGCLEISEPDDKLADPAWSALLKRGTSDLAKVRTDLADANTALEAIKRYAQTKDGMFTPRPEVTEEEFLDPDSSERAKELCTQVGGNLQDISRLQGEENRLLSREAALRPWMPLDMPLELEGTEHVLFRLGTCPGATDTGALRTALVASDAAVEVYEINADKQQKYYLLICNRSDEDAVLEVLRPYNFSVVTFQGVVGTAGENVDALEKQLAENRAAQESSAAAITEKAGDLEALRMYVDRLNAEVSKDTGAERLLTDGTILFFEGWAPAENLKELETFLNSMCCAWETADPTEEETPSVPVKLKNNWFTRPLNMVTEMYSLPSYSGVDPNPLMAPFFIFFYGFMMADMGYGLLMMLASWFIMKKAKPNGPTMRHMIPLLGLCGFSTFIMGALTGGFFGDLLPQLAMMLNPNTTFTAMPALFSPLNDALAVLIGSLAIGLAQIFTGMAISMYRQIKRGEVMAALCNEGAWYLVFIIFAVGVLAGQIKAALIVILVLLVLTQGYGKKGVLGKLMGIFGSLYNNITGYFSDILSYSRLMALMLAGAVIAQVFNTLGGITGNVITFFIISMIGNALNFALNLLGCYVHDMRLQCLEYFGRFYEDGGKPFRPISIEPHFVDIVKK